MIPCNSCPTGILLFIGRGFSGEQKGKHFLSAAGKKSWHLQSRKGGCRSGPRTSICSPTSLLLSSGSPTTQVLGHNPRLSTLPSPDKILCWPSLLHFCIRSFLPHTQRACCHLRTNSKISLFQHEQSTPKPPCTHPPLCFWPSSSHSGEMQEQNPAS